MHVETTNKGRPWYVKAIEINDLLLQITTTGRTGGEGGIRTLDELLTHTHFPGVRLKPLGHLTSAG